jgi:hypothetical protein
MDQKASSNIISMFQESIVKIDLSKKNPAEVFHFVSILKRLELENKIRIRVKI